MKFLLVLALCFVSQIALGVSLDADVSFEATGSPGFVHIDGKGGHATGNIGPDGNGTLTCPLDALTTGIALRDRHMKEKYLQTAEYPKAVLELEGFKPNGSGEQPWKGKLTLHGVTRSVTGTTTIDGSAFRAVFTVVLDDYKVGIPSYLGVTVAKTVTVTVSGAAK